MIVDGPFGQFVAALDQVVASAWADEEQMLTAVSVELRRLIAGDDWLDPACSKPHPEHYQQYLLHLDPQRRYSVVSFVWGPGQRTPIHDHTIWGVIGVLRGTEISEIFEPGEGCLVGHGEERFEVGDIALVSPRHGDIHRVSNALDDDVSISIHVYGGDIGTTERHVFDDGGGMRPFMSSYANAGPAARQGSNR